ncbi:RagB/SusD family nutrient uptake outer membrane protein [uncultured Parabacteroides sp.]|jgi:hypothetical protein|uniref:RagB/SusD family nutrient uptake outer membrane protein n=1 Tax=uncultured Parabacteroides sp. TaxID=512312 RepID=UPI0025E46F99|nr:RagB/SusD family nutrient uptake outer membrane protein [uncultured Parabacteroides sp.]
MKRITHILSVFVFLLSIQSCDLERAPLDQFSEDQFWTSEDNAMLALTGIYNANILFNGTGFASDWWDYAGLVMLENASDNCYDRRGVNSDYNRLVNGNLLPNNSIVSSYWKNTYAKITRCNRFLAGIENLDADPVLVNRFKSEVRFIRATQYFYLAQFFHDVPLVTKVLTRDEANTVEKSTRRQIVDFIITEFEESAEGLPRFKDLATTEIGRASKQAAMSFLGRVYLGEQDYEKAAGVYKQIIDFGDNAIDPNYASIFTTANENSSENIYSTQYVQDLSGCGMPQHFYPRKDGGWAILNPTASLFEAYQFVDGSDFSYDSPLYDPSDLSKNRDPRLNASIYYDGAIFCGTEFVCHPDKTSPDKITTRNSTVTGFLMRKYFDESYSGNLVSYGGNIPIIRYAEVLLSYLEAKLESGEPITQNLLDETINKIRTRESVNMPPVSETDPAKLRTLLRKERRVELALEGIRYWDLLRWGVAHEVFKGDIYGAPFPGAVTTSPNKEGLVDKYDRWYVDSYGFRNPQDYTWPIPQSEQDINPNLR